LTFLYADTGDIYRTFLFNEEETMIYAIEKHASSLGAFYIDKFSTLDFELIEQKEYTNSIPFKMFYRDGEIHLASYSGDFACTFIRPLGF